MTSWNPQAFQFDSWDDMSKTVNKFYVTVNGVLEEDDLLVEVARLEDERDNALLERDEAVAKASELAKELADLQERVKGLEALRASDWEKIKSWNNLTREKHEELVKIRKKEKALHGLLDQKDGHIQDLVAEYEKSIESLKSDLDATKESGRYFADRTLTLTQQVEDLQADLIEEKNIGAALERQLEISRQSALYWCDKYQSTTS